jgi:hypothetical protein
MPDMRAVVRTCLLQYPRKLEGVPEIEGRMALVLCNRCMRKACDAVHEHKHLKSMCPLSFKHNHINCVDDLGMVHTYMKKECGVHIASMRVSISYMKKECGVHIASMRVSISYMKKECGVHIASMRVSISYMKKECGVHIASMRVSISYMKKECGVHIAVSVCNNEWMLVASDLLAAHLGQEALGAVGEPAHVAETEDGTYAPPCSQQCQPSDDEQCSQQCQRGSVDALTIL